MIFGMCSFLTIYSQTHIWTGNGGNTDWFNAANWNVNSVPTNTSEVQIGSGFEANISGGDAFAFSIHLDDNGLMVLNSSLTITDQMVIGPTGNFLFSGGTLSGGQIEITGSMIINTQTLKTLENLTIVNSTQILVTDVNQIQLVDVTIDNEENAVIDIASVGGMLSQGNPSTLNNAGMLKKSPDGINPTGNFYLILDINNTGTISIPQDEVFLCLGGNITFNNLESGIIMGEGTFDITADFNNTGYIMPAGPDDTGTFHITNNFDVSAPGTISIDINSAADYDVIEVFGNPEMQGNFEVSCSSELQVGDEFTIVTSSNPISQCDFPSPVFAFFEDSAYEFEVICNQNSVVLEIVDEIILGLEENNFADDGLVIFPNPVRSAFQVNLGDEFFLENTAVSLRIYSYSGVEILRKPLFDASMEVDVSHLSQGIYLAEVNADVSGRSMAKFVKF